MIDSYEWDNKTDYHPKIEQSFDYFIYYEIVRSR